MNEEVQRTFRGWQGHFICPCQFHLNTLLSYHGKKVIVSTVGNYMCKDKVEEIGYQRTFETMVFESAYDEWDDMDVHKEMPFFKPYNDERAAQEGHYEMLAEVEGWFVEGGMIRDKR